MAYTVMVLETLLHVAVGAHLIIIIIIIIISSIITIIISSSIICNDPS